MKNIELLHKLFLEEYLEDGISITEIKSIENRLGIVLPDDLKRIASFFNGGEICDIENFPFYDDEDENNIVDETLRLRSTINLPPKYIVLAEPPESIIILDLENKPSVIWCNSYDLENLIAGKTIDDSDSWNSYGDYFEAMIKDEID